MATHNELGKKGEKIAEEYLINNGYNILHKNWRFKHKEIDIIAQNKEYLIICEVKTRSSVYFEDPYESVTITKQKFLIIAAEEYIIENDINSETRFDIISIIIDGESYKIEHIEDAFTPSWR